MRWAFRIAAATAVVAVLVWFPGTFGSFAFSEDLSRVEAEAEALAQGNEALAAQIVELESEIRALHDAGEPGLGNTLALREVERIAREDLNLIRPGEVVFEVHGVDRFRLAREAARRDVAPPETEGREP
jgi:cell division protein FtsB